MKMIYFILMFFVLGSCSKETTQVQLNEAISKIVVDSDYSGNGIYTTGDITVTPSGTTWTLDTRTSAIIVDSDCDGVADNLDKCPGIDDKIDNNNDGKPDCYYPPANYSQVLPAWKCGSPSQEKAFVCFKTNSGGKVTICTYYSAINTHIANGNRLGICDSKKCPGQ